MSLTKQYCRSSWGNTTIGYISHKLCLQWKPDLDNNSLCHYCSLLVSKKAGFCLWKKTILIRISWLSNRGCCVRRQVDREGVVEIQLVFYGHCILELKSAKLDCVCMSGCSFNSFQWCLERNLFLLVIWKDYNSSNQCYFYKRSKDGKLSIQIKTCQGDQ